MTVHLDWHRTVETAALAAVLAALLPGGAAAEPSARAQVAVDAPAGASTVISVDEVFDDPGTNPRFLYSEFSIADYYGPHSGLYGGKLWVKVKSDGELRALAAPPSSPFDVTATLEMINDEDETATAAVTIRTSYDTEAPGLGALPAGPAANGLNVTAPAGIPMEVTAGDAFDNAGTNPRLTDAEFSSKDYHEANSRLRRGSLWVTAKSVEDLLALPTPPPNPFTLTVTVTMENDEGETATGDVIFETPWDSE